MHRKRYLHQHAYDFVETCLPRWTKADVRKYVFEKARIKRGEWAECGKGSVVGGHADKEYAGESKFAMARLTDPFDIIRRQADSPEFLTLVKLFQPAELAPQVQQYALATQDDSVEVTESFPT